MAENYVSTNMETGVQVKEALTKIESYQPDLFAWTEIGDSVTVNLKSPTTYSGITDPGDYVIYKFSNGPSKIPSTLSPILLSLRDGKKYVSANGAIYTLNSAGDSWVSIDEAVDDDTILYVKSDTAPTRTNNTFWFDTSNFDGTSDGYIDLKYYDTTSASWISVFNEDNYLKKSVLDPDGKNTDIYNYITEKVAAVVGDYGEFIKHKANQLTLIHITADEHTQYSKIISESELRALINDTYKPLIKQTVDDSVSTELDTTQISADSTTLDNSYKSHLANHITADNIASWKNKAEADHIHDYTTGDTKLQASQIVSGTFGADQLPDEIKERYYEIITSPAVEFGNTSITDADRKAKYHNGNAFYYETTDETTGENVRKWYRIIDSTKIGTSSWADGIIDFTGKEANMDWSNITGRPTTLEEFGITTDLYTKTQVDEKFANITTQVENMNTLLADCEGDTGYEYGLIKLVWTKGMISSTNRYWYSICYGNGKFVAVTNSNYFAYSTDGINWTETTNGINDRNWWSVCYGNNKFVAVTYVSNYFAYSTDGINWTEGTISDTSRYWRSVCYGNGKFVAIANNTDYFAYSTDGITWTESILPNLRNWHSVCYGNDKFVAVASSNYFAYSTDGINWTESTISSTSRTWQSVCYGNGKFVAVAYQSNTFAYSMDGINWTEGTISSTSRNWYSVCYGNGKFVTVASSSNYFAYSTDGINWTEGTISDTSRNWQSVCYGNSKFVAVAENSNYFAYSPDSLMPLSIDRIGIQYKTQVLSEFDDTMTGTIPQLDCIIKTTDNKIYKTTYNLNSTYTKPDGTLYTTTDSKEPLGATMMEKIVPLTALSPDAAVEQYFNERFPDNYSTMNANPNFESSGCGIAVTANGTKKTLTVPNPADTSKALCTIEYSNDSLKFVYPKVKMVGNVIDVGIGSTDKINCLMDTYDKLKPIILNWKNIDFSSLSLNDTFYMGKYQVGSETPWDIEWEIVHQESDYQIAMAKQIIDLRCFDAKESSNSSGNNNWGASNIEQWLNSDASAGNWYSAQHSADAPPSSDNVRNNYNPYDTKPGFLYYWTDEEKAVLRDMTLTLANNTKTDGGGSYTWTGKVWLPTYTQMSGSQNNGISEGTQFSKFTDDNSRIKTIHAMCAANNQYCIDNSKTEGTAWEYWMSSAYPSTSNYLRRVYHSGNLDYIDFAYGGNNGLAPCIRLPR